MAYEDIIQRPNSEKILLVWIDPAERLLEWDLHSGSIYKRTVDYYVTKIVEDETQSIEVNSLSGITDPGKWYFDTSTKTLYYRSYADSDPSDSFSVGFYRIAFSTAPFIGPIDDNKKDVEYLSIIEKSPTFTHKLDHEDQIGVALSSSSSIGFMLDDFFIETYDRLIWKNKRVRAWHYFRELPFSDRKLYFDGVVDDKSYNGNTVTIKIRDFLDQLKERIPLDIYEEDDGDLPDSRIGKAKRRIYGRVTGLKAISTNQVLNGYLLSGVFSGNSDQAVITGSGSNLLDEAFPGDQITFDDKTYSIKQVNSNTEMVLSEDIKISLSSDQLSIKPARQSIRTGRNTNYVISDGHALKSLSTTIVEQITFARFKLNSTDGLLAGDIINIDGETRTIRRIVTGNIMVLTQNVTSAKSPGDSVVKNPVQKVFENGLQLTPERDYTITNLPTGATMTINSLAEFNVSNAEFLGGSLVFSNGSDSVSVSGIELRGNFELRDWIKPNNVAFDTWYEIRAIDEDNSLIYLRNAFSGSFSGQSLIRRISPITDETSVTVECFGKTEDGTENGTFIEYGPQIVRDLLLEAGITNLNLDSFIFANESASHTMSLPIPLGIDDEAPTLQDAITLINNSIFGSLHYNNDFQIEYNVLTSRKSESLLSYPIKDEDILNWSVSSTSKNIIRKIIGNYRFQDSDRFTGEKAFATVEYDNQFVKQVVESDRIETFDFHLWDQDSAQIMAERKSYMNELSQSVMTVEGKVNLNKYSINDKILFDLDRFYARIGSIGQLDRRKICIVSGVDKTSENIKLTVDDLGNIWNRTAGITTDDAAIFDLSGEEKIIFGYITDSDGLIDKGKETYRINLIG